jgi:hypothetical protein
MKSKICLLVIFAFVTLAIASPHTWILKTGETITGDYVSSGKTTVVVKTSGTNYFLKVSDLSTNDQSYVVKMHVAQTRSEAVASSSGDIMYYSSVLGIQTNAGRVFKSIAGFKKEQASPREFFTWKQKLTELAKAGYVPAQLMMARAEFSPADMLYWYKEAAKNGNAEAQWELAQELMTGAVVAQDFAEAARLYQQLAAKGDVRAKQSLSCLYAGNGTLRNLPEAIRLKEESGNYFGLAELGLDIPNLMDRAEIYKWYLVGQQMGDKYNGSPGNAPFENYSQTEFDEGERRANEYIKKRYNR